jgi:hypothetical protein
MRPKVDLRQLFSENIKVYLQLNNEFAFPKAFLFQFIKPFDQQGVYLRSNT